MSRALTRGGDVVVEEVDRLGPGVAERHATDDAARPDRDDEALEHEVAGPVTERQRRVAWSAKPLAPGGTLPS